MRIIFDSVHQETREGRKGPYDVMVVKGIKTYDNSQYERIFFPNEEHLVKTFKGFNRGDEIEITFGNDRFRSIEDANLVKKGNGAPAPDAGSSEPHTQASSPEVATPASVVNVPEQGTDVVVRATALSEAVELITAMMAQGNTNIKKGTTTDVLVDMTLIAADRFEDYLEGNSDEDDEPEEAEDNEEEGGDDVPPPSDGDVPY